MKNFIRYSGVVAAILIMAAFSTYYLSAKEYPDYFAHNLEEVNGLYFMFSCLAIGVFSGILFMHEYKDVFSSSIYLLCTLFFNLLLVSTLLDWITNDRIRMTNVYISIIIAGVISVSYTFIHYLRK